MQTRACLGEVTYGVLPATCSKLTSSPVLRDVSERGRDIEGCIKQWFAFVKPNFEQYVEPQRKVADIIVPRGVENRVAISQSAFVTRMQMLTAQSNGDSVH